MAPSPGGRSSHWMRWSSGDSGSSPLDGASSATVHSWHWLTAPLNHTRATRWNR